MAKSVEAARARRRRKAELQAKKEREFWAKAKKPLLIALCCVVVLIIGLKVAGIFIVPENAVPVVAGNLIGVQENWLVAKADKQYYHLADYTAPAGYAADESLSVNTDRNIRTGGYRAEDTEKMIQKIYVTTVKGTTAADNAARWAGGDTQTFTGEFAGYTVHGVYSQSAEMAEDGSLREDLSTAVMYLYIDTAGDSSVCFVVFSGKMAPDALPSVETMQGALPEVLAGLVTR